jgi:hypothetical protein
MWNSQTLLIILAVGTSSTSVGAAEADLLRFKLIASPHTGPVGICTMGWSADAIKKFDREQARYSTLSSWCKRNSWPISEKYHKLFKSHPVSYIATFDEGKETGVLHPTSRILPEANKAALAVLKAHTPFSYPPSELPFRKGLLIRLSSSGLTLGLAPHRKNR